ncbi:hypothetical protein FPV67DRAFT_1668835 [Lyophyllum atratum]|nr:hypothetical protein FPV67DRAFT_1668835 [Lyophyllum atratum]
MKAVDTIPLLLHSSLFFFFAGLVLFLIPVNKPLAVVIFTILAVSFTLYTWCTLLPVVFSDCPYRSPLSPWCWKALDILRKHRYPYFPAIQGAHPPSSMAQASASDAIRRSTKREERDLNVLSLTVQSLDNSYRLLGFVDHHNPSSPADNRHLTAMLLHTDLSGRLGRILKTSELCHPDEKAQRIPATLNAISVVAEMLIRNHYRGNTNIGNIYFGAKILAHLCSSDVIDNSDRVLRHTTNFRLLWLLLSDFVALAKELHEVLADVVKSSHDNPPLVDPMNRLFHGSLHERMTRMSYELDTLWDDLKAGHLKTLLCPSIIEVEFIWPLHANVMRVLQRSPHSPPPCVTALRYALEQSQILHTHLCDFQLFLLLDSLERHSPANTSGAEIDWDQCVAQLARCPISTLAQ